MKTKTWMQLFTLIAVFLLLFLTILSRFLIQNIHTVTSGLDMIIEENPQLSQLQNIPISELQEYSSEFNNAIEVLTSELPDPFDDFAYNYIDNKSFGDLRRDFERMEINNFSDIVAYIEHISINRLQIISNLLIILVIISWILLRVILFLHEKSEKKKKSSQEEALKEGRIIL